MRSLIVLVLGSFFLSSSLVFADLPKNITLSQHPKGIVVESADRILTEAYRRVGVPLKISHLPSKRALINANEGITDGEIMRIKEINKYYPNLLLIPVAFIWVDQVVLSKNISFKVDGCESLRPYKIGIRTGVVSLEECTKGMRVAKVTRIEQLIQMLDVGRIDILVTGSKLFLLGEIKKCGFSGMKVLTPNLKRLPLYHFLHKKHRDFVPIITKVLKDMEKEGYFIKERKLTIANLSSKSN